MGYYYVLWMLKTILSMVLEMKSNESLVLGKYIFFNKFISCGLGIARYRNWSKKLKYKREFIYFRGKVSFLIKSSSGAQIL